MEAINNTEAIEKKNEWIEYRKIVLDLIMLYHQVKSYQVFIEKNLECIELIKNYFVLSRKNTIRSFYITLGSILVNKEGSLCDFISKEEADNLIKIYGESKIRAMRNSLSHNNKEIIRVEDEDVENLYKLIIDTVKKVDEKYDDCVHYDTDIHGNDKITSIIPYIKNSMELHDIKDELLKLDYKGHAELIINGGKIKITPII